jgi:hypothetical protein
MIEGLEIVYTTVHALKMVQLGPKQIGVIVLKHYHVHVYAFVVHIVTIAP